MVRPASGSGSGTRAGDLLEGRNDLILAPIASGKTKAAVIPLLAALTEREPDGGGLVYPARPSPVRRAVVYVTALLPRRTCTDSEAVRSGVRAGAGLSRRGQALRAGPIHRRSGSQTGEHGPAHISSLAQLGRIGVPAINLRDEEVEAEIEAARELVR